MILCQLKPFNNKIGDTFQTKIGSIYLYCEQVDEDIYRFYIVGEQFKIYGYQNMQMNIHINSTTVDSLGPYTIEFADGIKHKIIIPRLIISGTGLGERTLYIEKNLYIIDEVNYYLKKITC